MQSLRLKGRETVIDRKNFLPQISDFYSVLLPELQNSALPGETLHFIAFESALDTDHSRIFMGIEHPGKNNDFDRWELSEKHFIANSNSKPLQWCWHTSESEEFLGEFRCDNRDFKLIANFYSRSGPPPADYDKIELLDYDPVWPEKFNEYAAWFKDAFGGKFSRIEHYGSTAICGLCAKDIVDVLVEIDNFDDARRDFLPFFNRPDHEYWHYDDHMIVIRRDAFMGRRTFHLHFATPNHRLWEGLKFRDYLCDHADTANEYAELKRLLSARYNADRERYTEEKTSFIRRVLQNC